MTASRDPDRLIHNFLMEGEEQLHDQVYDAVRAEIEQKQQRAPFGPWRGLAMNKITYGLGAAVVLIGAFIGAQYLGSPGNTGSGGPTATPEASSTAETTPTPEPSSTDSGRVVWLDGTAGLPVTMTVPAPGWDPTRNFFAIQKNGNSDPPDGAAILAFTDRSSWYVPGDACHSASSLPDTAAATVDEMVAAFSQQASREATAPVDISIAGYTGRSITIHVPDPMPTGCDFDLYCSFVDPTMTSPVTADSCARDSQGGGQIDELWIVDVDGTLVVLDLAYYEGTPATDVEEMRAIVGSISFEAP